MKHRVSFTAEADRNADEIYEWLFKRSPQGAADWFAALMAASRLLEDEPERRALAQEVALAKDSVRQLLFKTRRGKNYRLLFSVDGPAVSVLYVRGPGQSPITG